MNVEKVQRLYTYIYIYHTYCINCMANHIIPYYPTTTKNGSMANDYGYKQDNYATTVDTDEIGDLSERLQKDLRKGGLGVPEQIDDFGGTDRAIREAAEREAASTNIVAPDQRVVSNSSTTVVQSETITPSYSGYSMISTESDYG